MHFETLYGHDGLGRLAADVADLIPSGPAVTVAGVKYPVFKTLQERLTGLKHLETIFKYQSESLPLLELLQAFVRFFWAQYLQAKIQENALSFQISRILLSRFWKKNPDIRESPR